MDRPPDPYRTEPPRSRLVCQGCDRPAPHALAVRCADFGQADDVDHVLAKRLAWQEIGTPAFWREVFAREEPNPFVKFRELLHVYHTGLDRGLTDAEWVDLVRGLDAQVAKVDGRGFRATPFSPVPALSAALQCGTIHAKDETGNVAGSHKARHLFGLLIALTIARGASTDERPRLAIASCGNAALAAATLARAAGWPLQVFVPTQADSGVLARLRELGADVVTCARMPGVPGDPCVHRFREAVAAGAVPFSCQGNENGLVIDGGETLGYEIVASLLESRTTLDRIFVQVGGGALASATGQALSRAHAMGLLARLPRFHAVQTEGGHPLALAWARFVARFPGPPQGRALDEAIAFAARHRAMFMQPWPAEPKSLATGILDDETYDWVAVVRAMAESGGGPVVVPEAAIRRACDAVRATTSIRADATGTAGLAGCISLAEAGPLAGSEQLAVLLTGSERAAA